MVGTYSRNKRESVDFSLASLGLPGSKALLERESWWNDSAKGMYYRCKWAIEGKLSLTTSTLVPLLEAGLMVLQLSATFDF